MLPRMRYIVFVVDREHNTGNADEMAAIDAFNDRLSAGGHLIMAAGIAAPSRATLIDNRAGLGLVAPGSLQGAEAYSGFWIIEAPSADTAAAFAADGSRACNRRVELRPFLG